MPRSFSKNENVKPPNTFGALKELMQLDPSVDLTQPCGLEWNAEKGILYEK